MATAVERLSTSREAQLPQAERVLRPRVPDPLEGVIEGNTRYERYTNFVRNVLGKIWPRTPEAGEYGDDFWRPTRWDERKISGYTQSSPMARDPMHLTPEEFEIMVENLATPDYIRVRSVPQQLLAPNAHAIVVGGSCAIETWAMHTVADLKKDAQRTIDKQALANFSRAVVEMAPTVTHVSGAVLSGQAVTVHYVESDMWAERLEKYGIPREEAEQLVKKAFDGINEAIMRRAKLINPNTQVLIVNFDELDLDSAITRWFEKMNLQKNDHRVAEVIYTYEGPEQLELLKNALRTKLKAGISLDEEEVIREVLDANLHVRAKQIDHLRWGSMQLPKEVILGKRKMTKQERSRFESDHAFRMGMAIARFTKRVHMKSNPSVVCVGFADLPAYKNNVQHESRDVGVNFTGVPGTPESKASVEAALTTPARLHQGNVEDHLKFLRSFIVDTRTLRGELVARKQALLGEINPVLRPLREDENSLRTVSARLEKLEQIVADQQNVVSFIEYLMSVETEGKPTEAQREIAKAMKEQRRKVLSGIQKRHAEGVALTPDDYADLAELPALIAALDSLESEQGKPVLSQEAHAALAKIKDGIVRYMGGVLSQQINLKVAEQEELQRRIQEHQRNIELIAPKQEEVRQIDGQIAQLGLRTNFPLSENPFVHHAMQFLWDSDFALFLYKAVGVQDTYTTSRESFHAQRRFLQEHVEMVREEEKAKAEREGISQEEAKVRASANEALQELMTKLYPKLEAYIEYLYGKREYPMEMRNARLLAA